MKGVKHRAGNDPRAAALLVLNEVLTGTADSQAVLDKQLDASSLVPGDKALCTELVYGLLRRHLRLSWFIRQMLEKPDKLPAEMLLVLELAAYELAFTRIPAHASVNLAVGFIRNRFGQGLAKVGNGVLRRFQRNLKDEFENPLYYLKQLKLEVSGGHPQSLDHSGQVSDRELSGCLTNQEAANSGELSGNAAEEQLGEVSGGLPSVLGYSAEPGFLAVYYGMPEWIVRLWLAAYGPEAAERYLKASARPAPLGLRLNSLAPGCKSLLNEMLQEEGALLVPPAAVALPNGARRPVKFMQREGRLSRQSAASYQALWQLEPASWEQPVWDACAGRGGKTLSLLEQGIAVALLSDSSKARLGGFEPDFKRLFYREGKSEDGGSQDKAVSGQALASSGAKREASSAPVMPEVFFGPAEEAGKGREFATVILDVPCSGLGTLAHRPEIRWRRNYQDLERLCASQGALLENAVSSLKRGGRIVYLTCTINPAENEEQVKSFLERHPGFTLEKTWNTPPGSGLSEFFYGAVLKQDEQGR